MAHINGGTYEMIPKPPGDGLEASVTDYNGRSPLHRDNDLRRDTDTFDISPTSRVGTALQTVGLKTLPSLQKSKERPKPALQDDRPNALLRLLVHIVPLGGAVALLSLNFSKYFIGYTNEVNTAIFPALQFAAKLHELFMIASLTVIFMALMRSRLLSTQGLPFGAAFAGQHITYLTYLWSADLWGSMTSGSYGVLSRVFLFLQIAFFALLIAVVGPSSAALMIPRPGTWQHGSVFPIYTNATREDLFPTSLTMASYENISCGGASAVGSGDNIGEAPGSCPWSLNNVTLALAILLTPSISSILDSLQYKEFGSRLSIGLPSVDSVQLWGWDPDTEASRHNLTYVYHSESQTEFPPPDTNYDYYSPYRNGSGWSFDTTYTSTQSSTLVFLASEILRNSYFAVGNGFVEILDSIDAYSKIVCSNEPKQWYIRDPRPTLLFDNGTIQVESSTYFSEEQAQYLRDKGTSIPSFADIIFTELHTTGLIGIVSIAGFDPNVQQFELDTCTLSLSWADSTLGLDHVGVSSRRRTQPAANLRTITADKAWFDSLNPYLPELNATLYTYIAQILGAGDVEDNYLVPALVSTFSTVMLSAMSSSRLLIKKGWTGSPESFDESNSYAAGYGATERDPSGMQFNIRRSAYGYGYGQDSLALHVSLAILLIYCAVVFVYVAYVVVYGISSSAWDSLNEVLALAINSRPAMELQNTCAGISRVSVFRHPVRIVATDGVGITEAARHDLSPEDGQTAESALPKGRHLELVFNPSSKEASVRINERYGAIASDAGIVRHRGALQHRDDSQHTAKWKIE